MGLFNAGHLMSLNPEAKGNSGWNTDDLDMLMAKIDAAADAMTDDGVTRGQKILAGVVGSA